MAIIHPPLPCIFSLPFYPWFLCIILSTLASSFLPLYHPPSPCIISSPLLASSPSHCITPTLTSFPNCIILSPYIIQLPLRTLLLPLASLYFPLHHSPLHLPLHHHTFPCITLPTLSPCIICQLEELVLESQVWGLMNPPVLKTPSWQKKNSI